jgi:hypothetical protein
MFKSHPYTTDAAESAFNMMARKSANWTAWIKSYFKGSAWQNLTSLQKSVVASYIGNKVHDHSRDARLAGNYWLPVSVANIDKIIEEERLLETQPVTDLSRFEVINNQQSYTQTTAQELSLGPESEPSNGLSCQSIFSK